MLLQWYRIACTYAHKYTIFYESINDERVSVPLHFTIPTLDLYVELWRRLQESVAWLSTSGFVNWSVKINHYITAPSFLWRNLSLFQLNLSLVCDVYFWLAVVISWVLARHSREKLFLHAAFEQFWIHSNAGSIGSFAVSYSFTRDFTVISTWIFSRLIQTSLSSIRPKYFLYICSRSCPICRHPLYSQTNGS